MPKSRNTNTDNEGGLPSGDVDELGTGAPAPTEPTPLPLPTEGGSWTRDEQGLLVPYTPPHQE